MVLDNMDHLLDGVDLFAEMIEEAPGLKLLATSRESLCLQKEWVLRVDGFPTPPIDGFEARQEYSAVTLFLQTARRACVGFELQAEDWPAVVRICQLVGGMPLGIELAAAWVPLLSCDEIAHEIERNLDFLTTTHRDVPDRQRSLRAVFEHSWNLLSLDERRILCQIAVFRGGFCRDAARQVAGATLPLLSRLVSKSLLQRTDRGPYDLHPVIQQYALTHLALDPAEERAARDRHCEYYLTLLQAREKELKSAGQQQAVRDLSEEIDNMRDAWTWAVKHRKFSNLRSALYRFGLLCDSVGNPSS